MPISDWSSDVFSSDLHRHRIGIGDIGHDQADKTRTASLERLRHGTGHIAQLLYSRFDLAGDFRRKQGIAMIEIARNSRLGYARLEIGRAWCRERVRR